MAGKLKPEMLKLGKKTYFTNITSFWETGYWRLSKNNLSKQQKIDFFGVKPEIYFLFCNEFANHSMASSRPSPLIALALKICGQCYNTSFLCH
jgi:hypothetical protein